MKTYGPATNEQNIKNVKEDKPLDILNLKLANMEIDIEEYQKRKKIIENSS